MKNTDALCIFSTFVTKANMYNELVYLLSARSQDCHLRAPSQISFYPRWSATAGYWMPRPNPRMTLVLVVLGVAALVQYLQVTMHQEIVIFQ